ncbi:MAG TPA: HAD-IA family hydrolase [Acidothermaceae bacterium]
MTVAAPRAVLLDAGGVLLLPNPWVVSAVLRAAGGAMDPDAVPRAHYAGVAAMDARRTTDWSYYHRVFVRFAGVPSNRIDDALAGLAALFRSPVPTTWNVVPAGVIEHLRDLAATGVAIAVVSNADGLVEATLRRCEIPFDVVIDSTVVGYAKPQPEIFAFALEKLNVAASDAVHVGDMASADVDGAHAAGVRPLHLDPFNDCPYPADHHEHVRTLADVVAIAAG